MPWNGSGVFSRLYSWVADDANGVDILASRMDQDSDDIATGLGHCLTVNGETVPTANLRMNGFTVTGLADGAAATDAVTFGQLQSGYLPLAGGSVAGSLSVSGNISAGGTVAVGGGLYWEDNGGWMYTPWNLWTGAALNVNGVEWSNNGGYMYTASPILTGSLVNCASLTTNNGAVACGAVTCSTINTQGFQITAGPVSCSTISAAAVTCTSLNTQGGSLNCGAFAATGNINAPELILSGQGVVYGSYNGTFVVGFDYNGSALYAMISGSNIGQIQITPSDARLKRNIEPVTLDALAVLGELQLYAYDRLDPVDGTARHHEVGFVAQELQGLIPEAVISGGRAPPGDDRSPLLSLDLMPLLAYTVRAIQQLRAELAALRGG